MTDGRRVYVNRTGNPGMATGGAGDVLTGVIAALIGQKLPAFEAAQLGVYIHGLAGDIARDQNGAIGMIAGDIVDALPDAFDHASAWSPKPDCEANARKSSRTQEIDGESRIVRSVAYAMNSMLVYTKA